ncbi:MAG: FAD-binding oxidoreductase, partial [Candidatus Eremiobacteraeota bacterium]|nr:FAD-binding oxidoreductase [Candidatus Eremiobacteraeota bacterium]
KTSRLSRVVEYAPADMVVEVEAGLTLAALQKHLAPHRQRLALDVPHAELATLGGLVATNGFGPRRARYGSLRDAIVGVSLIRADGLRVRGGGKVVKNVAGFDLPKLAVGSLGSLGMIATATFRLHPLPETARSLRIAGCDGAMLDALGRDMLARQLEPSAYVAVLGASGSYDAYVLFEGFDAGVAEQAAALETLALGRGLSAERLDGSTRPSKLDEEARTHGDVRLRLTVPPADLEALERGALAPLLRVLGEPRGVIYPTLGIAFVSGFAAELAATAATIAEARRGVETLGGNLVVLEIRDGTLANEVDPYGALPGSFFLMQRLKERFDPDRRLNPGRFLGGL